MTNIIIHGQSSSAEKKQHPIRLVKFLREDHVWKDTKDKASSFKNIELVCMDYADGWSLMLAYQDNRNEAILFLGYFNDGVIDTAK